MFKKQWTNNFDSPVFVEVEKVHKIMFYAEFLTFRKLTE